MHRILFTFLDAVIAGFILAPVFWYKNKNDTHNSFRSTLYFLFSVYLCATFSVAGLPDIRYIRFNPHVNLEPFAYMFSDWPNSLLNVILFLPLGFFLSVLWKKEFPLWKTMLLGFATSFLIELLQIFTYRATDINDLITNTSGTLVGWGLSKLCPVLFRGLPKGPVKDVFYVYAVSFLVMFFLHPFLADLLLVLISRCKHFF